ncbi:hypothetical protein BRD05_05120 [Halobacteriales archaeon QS_9_70_65]|nr:MAG: hypothetical protein BRD05_05120 [Halobacteriales archaeon QS_9_70_65]
MVRRTPIPAAGVTVVGSGGFLWSACDRPESRRLDGPRRARGGRRVADGEHVVVLDHAVSRRAVGGIPDPGPELAAVEWLRPDGPRDDLDRPLLAHHDEILRTA